MVTSSSTQAPLQKVTFGPGHGAHTHVLSFLPPWDEPPYTAQARRAASQAATSPMEEHHRQALTVSERSWCPKEKHDTAQHKPHRYQTSRRPMWTGGQNDIQHVHSFPSGLQGEEGIHPRGIRVVRHVVLGQETTRNGLGQVRLSASHTCMREELSQCHHMRNTPLSSLRQGA